MPARKSTRSTAHPWRAWKGPADELDPSRHPETTLKQIPGNGSKSESSPPWNFTPRPYQRGVFDAQARGVLRQFHVWHRRAGKDRCGLALASVAACNQVANYWHLFPKQTQARRAIWNGISRDGRRFIDDAFPAEHRAKTRDGEMMLELKNGSTWQMAGSDNYDSLVGSNVRGIVFSEFALCDPAAWPYFQPILRENGGWAIFITTFRGKNHAWRMFNEVRELEDWHTSILTVDDTSDGNGRRIITADDINKDRREGMSEATIREEYFCEPQEFAHGSYYARVMNWLAAEGRLSAVGYEPGLPLYAAWHVSEGAVAVILVQVRGTEARIIASRSWRNIAIADALEELRETVPFARHIRKCITKSNVTAFELAGYLVDSSPKHKLPDAVELVRQFLPTVRIDTDPRPFAPGGNNRELLDSLQSYGQARRANELEAMPNWEEFLADAIHTWAAYREDAADSWGAAPNYRAADRAVI